MAVKGLIERKRSIKNLFQIVKVYLSYFKIIESYLIASKC
jgi:hypothetical protein